MAATIDETKGLPEKIGKAQNEDSPTDNILIL